MNRIFTVVLVLLGCALVPNLGCTKKPTTETTTDPSTGGGGGGGGGTGSTLFTATDIAKAWVSTCVSSTNSTLNTSYYKNYLTLNADSTFMFIQYLYVSNGLTACANPNYDVVLVLYGTYTVGSLVSGSTTLQDITFNVTVGQTDFKRPSIAIVDPYQSTPTYTSIQNIFNNDCGGTSPYCTLSNQTCTNNGVASGVSKYSNTMTCQNFTFPNVSNPTVYNLGSYDSGTGTLTLGAGGFGIPGVFSQGSVPASATIVYH